MLNSLRKYASSWVAQLLLGILVLSFAVWGVADVFTGFRSDSVAQVGSIDISVNDFRRDYTLAIDNFARQLGTPISPETAKQMGIPGQILGRLVNQATLDDAATKLGIGISNDTLGQKIATDPQFFGAGGAFDRGYLAQIIRAQGMTEDQFIVSRRREYIRGQLGQAFAGGITAPETYLRAFHEFRNEERDVSYVLLPAPPVTDVNEPTEADLTTYFDAHKADWKAPEFRAVSYFNLSPGEVARPADVSDDDAKARYDSNPQRFTTVEKRKTRQIVFPDRAAADAAAAALAAGQTFDALVAERSLKPEDVDLGLVTREQLADPAIADAAFALATDGVSPVVEGRFGPVILHVTAIEPALVTTFAEVKDALKAEIANERAVTDIAATHDAIEDARAAGSSLSEVAGKYGLSVATVAEVDETGKDSNGSAVANLPAPVLTAAFETDVGLENDPVPTDRNSFAWYEVTAVAEARERTLSEVHDKVVAAWKEAERRRLLTEQADALKIEVEKAGDLAKVAAERFLEIRKAPKLTRLTKPSGDLSATALAAVFGATKGSVVAADGGQPLTALVLAIDNILVPPYAADAPDLAQQKQQLDSQFVGNLLAMYVGELQTRSDVRFNQAVLEQVLGATGN